MKYLVLAQALFAAAAAWSQPATPASFEVATVKVAAPCCAPGQWRESKAIADRIDFRYVTLKYCLAFAYGIKEYQVAGPPFLGELRFDILAKGPEGTRREQLPAMMQSLLKDRFKLEAHQEKKEFSVYVLQVGKNGPKLKESSEEDQAAENSAFGMSMNGGVGHLEAKHADMASLTNTLPRLVGRPVVNQTGLTRRYDFDLEFMKEDLAGIVLPSTAGGTAPPAAEFGTSIFNSIQHLGLKLDSQKLPLDTIVVDRSEKTPTEN
ncbi:MAG TPA: TIGR03435 family protein [Candidatus Acidoferrales bacterium]|nr:TIGR03435 family protein [Candidatus Acidoferrales bacterium]